MRRPAIGRSRRGLTRGSGDRGSQARGRRGGLVQLTHDRSDRNTSPDYLVGARHFGDDPVVAVDFRAFVQEGLENTREYLEVRGTAESLLELLTQPSTVMAMENANQPGNSSQMVQLVFAEIAVELGFTSEKTGLFATYPTSGLRPDFFKPVLSSGILLEVERGKTTTNNMDLLDFWKCHLCVSANHLFLAVPKALKHNDLMTAKKEFASVTNRLSAFFVPGNYTNVRSLTVFGY